MAKPSDNEEQRERNHENSGSLAPKTARELVLWRGFFDGTAFGGFGCFFALCISHVSIIAHFKEKHKRYGLL